MATAEPMSRPHGEQTYQPTFHGQKLMVNLDRHSRRRPFTSWVKRLANLKNSSESSSHGGVRSKKNVPNKNNPYPASGVVDNGNAACPSGNSHLSFATPPSGISRRDESPGHSKTSLPISHDGQHFPTSNKSTAPTVSTNPDTTHSDAARSKAGTVDTAGGALSSNGIGGEGSTFSSPAPSVRSMTTTLTTIQSAAPANLMGGSNNQSTAPVSTQQSTQFSHQFPSSPPASAIPSHVTGVAGSQPSTYTTATANNLLTDNASILTLASSSKRRRRNSLDTNASVRALAPSSIFGGSRESLPLSILSGPVGDSTSGLAAVHNRPSVGGLPAAERASVYSSSGVVPTVTSERNSYVANKQGNAGDGGSVRSGLISHGRNDSTAGSIGGPGSSWTSPREQQTAGKTSRRNSVGWGEVGEELGEDDKEN